MGTINQISDISFYEPQPDSKSHEMSPGCLKEVQPACQKTEWRLRRPTNICWIEYFEEMANENAESSDIEPHQVLKIPPSSTAPEDMVNIQTKMPSECSIWGWSTRYTVVELNIHMCNCCKRRFWNQILSQTSSQSGYSDIRDELHIITSVNVTPLLLICSDCMQYFLLTETITH